MKTVDSLEVAIVGAGRMGQARAAAIRSLGGRVAHVVDPDESTARALAVTGDGPAAAVHASADDLPLETVSAVFVCTPPSLRDPLVGRALAVGSGVFVEKPLALDAAAARALAAHAGPGSVTAVGYMNRYRAGVVRLQERLRSESLMGLSAVWFGGRYARDWWADPLRSGGPINEQATHLVDLLRTLGGEITEVVALPRGERRPAERVEGAAAVLRFESGVAATLLYSCEATSKDIWLEAVTTSGRHTLDGWDFKGAPADAGQDVFLDETRAFLEALAAGDPAGPRCPLHEAARTQEAVDALRRALDGGTSARPGA